MLLRWPRKGEVQTRDRLRTKNDHIARLIRDAVGQREGFGCRKNKDKTKWWEEKKKGKRKVVGIKNNDVGTMGSQQTDESTQRLTETMQIDAMENVDVIETLRLKFYNDNSSTTEKKYINTSSKE